MSEDFDLLSVLQEPPQGPFAQAGSMLQGYAAGFRGQQNPAILQAQQEQRNRLAVAGVVQAAQRERREQTRMKAEMLGYLAKSEYLEASQVGTKGLIELAQKSGAILPNELSSGLLTRRIKPAELEEVQKLIARRVPPPTITQAYPWATPQVLEGLTGEGADFLAMSFKWKTPDQMRKDAAEADLKSVQALRAEQYPEVAGNSELQQFIQLAHKSLTVNGKKGLTYYEGTDESRGLARTQGKADWLTAQAAKHPVHAGERIVTPTGGQYFNRKTRNFDPAVPAGELEANRENFVFVPTRDIELRGYATRSMPTLIEIKRLIPRLLATQPAENIVKALELQGAKLTASSEDLRRLNALVFDANLEQVRALGGSSVVRQRLLELLSRHAGISTLDTQKTALGVIDISMINMENLRRTPVRDPILRLDQRIGPGRYLTQDRKTGQKFIANVPEGQITPPEWIILGNQ